MLIIYIIFVNTLSCTARRTNFKNKGTSSLFLF